jgi:hypothetical protein
VPTRHQAEMGDLLQECVRGDGRELLTEPPCSGSTPHFLDPHCHNHLYSWTAPNGVVAVLTFEIGHAGCVPGWRSRGLASILSPPGRPQLDQTCDHGQYHDQDQRRADLDIADWVKGG